MNSKHKNEIFRLATVLYADNTYEVNLSTIHRKIVESILLELHPDINISSHRIIEYASEQYNLVLTEKCISKILEKDSDKFNILNEKGDLLISLTENRLQILKQKTNNNTIDFFISEFEIENPQYNNVKDSLYSYLYDIFSTNTESFKKLLNKDEQISELLNTDNGKYSEAEKEIINGFLNWDNSAKNKAIFDISSYALEYCMLTNKDGGTTLKLEQLKKKHFYLDTNIIYRGLGINGEDRKNRTFTFLHKFLEADEKLVISKVTEDEFKDSIRGHIKRLQAYNTPRIQSRVFQKHKIHINRDMYSFYHHWRADKANTNETLFEAYILTLYAEFKKKFNIEFESNFPYDRKSKENIEVIQGYTSEIVDYKTYYHYYETPAKAELDAENIFWIENKRNTASENIFDTKHFFISTDQGLRRWDYIRKRAAPIVLHPSQWLTILLRYFKCTNDDYKSFISFLNLKNTEKLIDGDRIHVVLSGISEMTENIEHQNIMMDKLIENKFADVLKGNRSIDNKQLHENSKIFAKTELEILVEQQQHSINQIKEEHKKEKEERKNLTSEVNSLNDKLLSNQKESEKRANLNIAQLKKEIFDLDKLITTKENKFSIEEEKCEKSYSFYKEYFNIAIELVLLFSIIILFFLGAKHYIQVQSLENFDLSHYMHSMDFIKYLIGVVIATFLFIFRVRKESYIFNWKDIKDNSIEKQKKSWLKNNPNHELLQKEIKQLKEDRKKLITE